LLRLAHIRLIREGILDNNWCGGKVEVDFNQGNTEAIATTAGVMMAVPLGGGCSGCLACLQDIVRALSMGSCLTVEQRPTMVAGAAHKGRDGKERKEEVHGRIIGNGVGNLSCMFTRQGKKGTNQDAMVVWEVCIDLSYVPIDLDFFTL
jgi:hypothetical protein